MFEEMTGQESRVTRAYQIAATVLITDPENRNEQQKALLTLASFALFMEIVAGVKLSDETKQFMIAAGQQGLPKIKEDA